MVTGESRMEALSFPRAPREDLKPETSKPAAPSVATTGECVMPAESEIYDSPVNAEKVRSDAERDPTCQRCDAPRSGTKYCKPCSIAVARERGLHPERRKPCPECGNLKEPGKRRYCIACWTKRQPVIVLAERNRARYKSRQQRLARGIQPRMPKVDQEGRIRCSLCQLYLLPTEFSAPGKSGKHPASCRSCYSTYLHEQRIGTLYGLTLEDYERLFDLQGGRCAICECQPRTRRLAVDHDHVTGEVRGLLCTRCNHKLIGAARESSAILRRAAWYLDNPPALSGKAAPSTAADLAEMRLEADLDKAIADAKSDEIPHVVTRVDGREFVTMTGATFVRLLRTAGYGTPISEPESDPEPASAGFPHAQAWPMVSGF